MEIFGYVVGKDTVSYVNHWWKDNFTHKILRGLSLKEPNKSGHKNSAANKLAKDISKWKFSVDKSAKNSCEFMQTIIIIIIILIRIDSAICALDKDKIFAMDYRLLLKEKFGLWKVSLI